MNDEIEFKCPRCGGWRFGRDTGEQDGKVVVLKTVRCHAAGCGWRGVWPPVNARGKKDAEKTCKRRLGGLRLQHE